MKTPRDGSDACHLYIIEYIIHICLWDKLIMALVVLNKAVCEDPRRHLWALKFTVTFCGEEVGFGKQGLRYLYTAPWRLNDIIQEVG